MPKKRGCCPICEAPITPESRPFCSPRCANIDLARWLGGVYAIPGERPDSLDLDDEKGSGDGKGFA